MPSFLEKIENKIDKDSFFIAEDSERKKRERFFPSDAGNTGLMPFVFIAVSVLAAVFLYFNIVFWQSFLLGALCLALWLAIMSVWLDKVLAHFLPLGRASRRLFGVFAAIYALGFAGALFVVFYKLTPFFILLSFLSVSALASFLNRRHRNKPMFGDPTSKHSVFGFSDAEPVDSDSDNNDSGGIKIPKFCYVLCAMCYALCIFLLFKSRTGEFILSPWEAVHPVYVGLFLLLTAFVVFLIFSKHKARVILVVIILHSFLLHAYLPVVYKVGFGGDKWRHIGAEKWIGDGKIYTPSLFGEDEVSMRKLGPLEVPEVLVAGNKTSYANQWALTAIISRSLGVDEFHVDFWLLPLLWSVFVPLLLYKIGHLIFNEKRFLLLMAFLPALFYPFQVYGGITIPVAFGFLYFLFAAYARLSWMKSKDKKKGAAAFLAVITGLMYLNYIVYLILILEVVALIFLVQKFQKNRNKILSVSCYALCAMCFMFFIPALDAFYKLSHFKQGFLADLPLIFGQFLAKLFAFSPFVPRPDFISQGNFLYMQTGESLSGSALMSLVPWPIIISLLAWAVLAYGMKKAMKTEGREPALVLALLLAITLGNHFVAWYFMDGIRLLSKRLDLTIAFLMIPFLALGIAKLAESSGRMISKKAKVLAVCIILPLACVSTYASGPKLQTVTDSEHEAAKYVWGEYKARSPEPGAGNYCVLANTWPLLALEAASGMEIVAGNFPVYGEYAQPERVQLFKKMSDAPSVVYMERAMEITGADHCYFMTEERWMNSLDSRYLEKLEKALVNHEKIGDVYIFHYGKEARK